MDLATIPADNYPTVYENAKTALVECNSIDECKGWTDKAAAMRTYASQMKDESLLRLAAQIRMRAERRVGEILIGTINGKPGPKSKDELRVGNLPQLNTKQTAIDAGLSPFQMKEAQQIAKLKEPEFEALVENQHPVTKKSLTQAYKKQKQTEEIEKGIVHILKSEEGYPLHWVARLRDLTEKCDDFEPEFIGSHLFKNKKNVLSHITKLEQFLAIIKKTAGEYHEHE